MIGEQEAVDELSKLSDSFVIINDFKYEFRSALHKRETDEWIKSIQADHVVIGPSGVFVIETKNWSAASVQSLGLYSPVEQVKRTNYALFMPLNRGVDENLLSSFIHHWGSRKIAVHSILLMTNARPDKEFQHVKILNLGSLRRHVTYFRQELAEPELQDLANFFLQRCD